MPRCIQDALLELLVLPALATKNTQLVTFIWWGVYFPCATERRPTAQNANRENVHNKTTTTWAACDISADSVWSHRAVSHSRDMFVGSELVIQRIRHQANNYDATQKPMLRARQISWIPHAAAPSHIWWPFLAPEDAHVIIHSRFKLL